MCVRVTNGGQGPTSIVFSHEAVDESYAQFDVMFTAMRRADESARALHGRKDPQKWRGFTENIEELIWATEWVHLALARRPGE